MTKLLKYDDVIEAIKKVDRMCQTDVGLMPDSNGHYLYDAEILEAINATPPAQDQSERFVVRRRLPDDIVLYACAHHHGVFDWGDFCEAVRFDTKLQALALIASMHSADDAAVSIQSIDEAIKEST